MTTDPKQKKSARVVLTVRVSVEGVAAATRVARAQGITRSELLRRAFSEYIARHDAATRKK